MGSKNTRMVIRRISRFLPKNASSDEIKKFYSALKERAGSNMVIYGCAGELIKIHCFSRERLELLIDLTVKEYASRRLKPYKDEPHSDYHKLWRLIDGAVISAFEAHPDYLTQHGKRRARQSIVKRAVGALLQSFAEAKG